MKTGVEPSSHSTLSLASGVMPDAATIMTTKPSPVAQPSAILFRLEGSLPRCACRAHTMFSSGTSSQIMKGLKDWYQVDGIVKPNTVGQCVFWSAHSCMVLPCCS